MNLIKKRIHLQNRARFVWSQYVWFLTLKLDIKGQNFVLYLLAALLCWILMLLLIFFVGFLYITGMRL